MVTPVHRHVAPVVPAPKVDLPGRLSAALRALSTEPVDIGACSAAASAFVTAVEAGNGTLVEGNEVLCRQISCVIDHLSSSANTRPDLPVKDEIQLSVLELNVAIACLDLLRRCGLPPDLLLSAAAVYTFTIARDPISRIASVKQAGMTMSMSTGESGSPDVLRDLLKSSMSIVRKAVVQVCKDGPGVISTQLLLHLEAFAVWMSAWLDMMPMSTGPGQSKWVACADMTYVMAMLLREGCPLAPLMAALLRSDCDPLARFFRLLLPSMAAAAVEAALPPGSGREVTFGPPFVASLGRILQSPAMEATLDSCGARATVMLLQNAAQLFARFDIDNSNDGVVSVSLLRTLSLASAQAMLLGPELELEGASNPRAHHLLKSLQTALLRLPDVLAQALEKIHAPGFAPGVPPAVWVTEMVTHVSDILKGVVVISSATSGDPAADSSSNRRLVTSVPELVAWSRTATQLLRMLPQVLAAQQQQLQDVAAVDFDEAVRQGFLELWSAVTCLADLVTQFAFHLVTAAERRSTAHNPAEGQEAMAALWGLHSALCRLLQLTSRPAAAGGLPSSWPMDFVEHGFRRLVLIAKSYSSSDNDSGAIAAMSAAHFETLLGMQGGSKVDLSSICSIGPPALVAHPSTLRLMRECIENTEPKDLPTTYQTILQGGSTSPHFAALLVSHGLVDEMLQWFKRRGATCQEVSRRDLTGLLMKLMGTIVRAVDGVFAGARLRAAGPEEEALLDRLKEEALLDRLKEGVLAYDAALGRIHGQLSSGGQQALEVLQVHALPIVRQQAQVLEAWWQLPAQRAALALEVAQAAAARSCAYLRCANLGGQGGPAAGQGVGSLKCSACRAVWYCGPACSQADWRDGGHKRVCAALGAARREQRAGRAAAPSSAAEQC